MLSPACRRLIHCAVSPSYHSYLLLFTWIEAFENLMPTVGGGAEVGHHWLGIELLQDSTEFDGLASPRATYFRQLSRRWVRFY